MKKKYSSPQFLFFEVELDNVLKNSPENFSSYVDGPGDWGEDPTIDPDDDIVW